MIIGVCIQKGGVGKTVTCLNLGAAAALDGKKTCLIDMDSQGNLTKTLMQQDQINYTINEALKGEPIQASLYQTEITNLYLVPASLNLAGLERTAAHDPRLAYRLQEALTPPFLKEFDLVIIDTPPTLGALTINAMTAATHLLIPIQPSVYPLQGLNDLMQTYQLVKTKLNPALDLLGVLINLYDPRTTIAREAMNEIKAAFGDKVFSTVIRRSVKIEESPASGQSVITYAPKSPAAGEYLGFYREVLRRAGMGESNSDHEPLEGAKDNG